MVDQAKYDCGRIVGGTTYTCTLTAALVIEGATNNCPTSNPCSAANCEGSWHVKLNATTPAGSDCASVIAIGHNSGIHGGAIGSTTWTPWADADNGDWPVIESGSYSQSCGGTTLVDWNIYLQEAGTAGLPVCVRQNGAANPVISRTSNVACEACLAQ